MSGEFDSRKNSYSTQFAKLSFRELCDSEFSSLYPFNNMAIIHSIKNMSKTER